MNLTVVCEPWRPHPLAWIHRVEAKSVTAELRSAGHDVRLVRFREGALHHLTSGNLLLRLSDPVMRVAVHKLEEAGKPFIGPRAAVMERCYDKYEAYRIASRNGVDCPPTARGDEPMTMGLPLVVKPRRGSDSLGVRVLRHGRIPANARTPNTITQSFVRGEEITVAVCAGQVGVPLKVQLPEGTPYSFFRKYLLRPGRAPLAEADLAARVRREAAKIAATFAVDWAARIDLIHETATGRLYFLECDVAPLVGAQSAFSESFAAAGVDRAVQLKMLLKEETAGN